MHILKTELLANHEHQLKNHELLFYCWPAEFTVSVSIAIRIEEKPSTHILVCIYGQMFHVWFFCDGCKDKIHRGNQQEYRVESALLDSLNEGFNSKGKVVRSVGGEGEGKEQGSHGYRPVFNNMTGDRYALSQ